jgi:hypothetical protein
MLAANSEYMDDVYLDSNLYAPITLLPLPTRRAAKPNWSEAAIHQGDCPARYSRKMLTGGALGLLASSPGGKEGKMN